MSCCRIATFICGQSLLTLCPRCQEIPTTQHYIPRYRNSPLHLYANSTILNASVPIYCHNISRTSKPIRCSLQTTTLQSHLAELIVPTDIDNAGKWLKHANDYV